MTQHDILTDPKNLYPHALKYANMVIQDEGWVSLENLKRLADQGDPEARLTFSVLDGFLSRARAADAAYQELVDEGLTPFSPSDES